MTPVPSNTVLGAQTEKLSSTIHPSDRKRVAVGSWFFTERADSSPVTTNPHFEEVKQEAADALTETDLRSVYTGIVHEDGRHEYYFGNDTEDAEALREAAAVQLGMLLRVLADQSDSDVETLSELAVERAEQMELR
jgi:hypothetical protein